MGGILVLPLQAEVEPKYYPRKWDSTLNSPWEWDFPPIPGGSFGIQLVWDTKTPKWNPSSHKIGIQDLIKGLLRPWWHSQFQFWWELRFHLGVLVSPLIGYQNSLGIEKVYLPGREFRVLSHSRRIVLIVPLQWSGIVQKYQIFYPGLLHSYFRNGVLKSGE